MVSPRIRRYYCAYADETEDVIYAADLFTWPENSITMGLLYRELKLYPTLLAREGGEPSV